MILLCALIRWTIDSAALRQGGVVMHIYGVKLAPHKIERSVLAGYDRNHLLLHRMRHRDERPHAENPDRVLEGKMLLLRGTYGNRGTAENSSTTIGDCTWTDTKV